MCASTMDTVLIKIDWCSRFLISHAQLSQGYSFGAIWSAERWLLNPLSDRHGLVRCPSHEFRPNFCLSNWIMVNVHLWDGHHPVSGLTWLVINNLWLCAYWLVLVFVLSHIINSDCLWMTIRESWNRKITTCQGLVRNNFSSVVYAKMPPEPS